jgi:hypothetical protein
VICPSGTITPSPVVLQGARTRSPGTRVRYAAHFGLNADGGQIREVPNPEVARSFDHVLRRKALIRLIGTNEA